MSQQQTGMSAWEKMRTGAGIAALVALLIFIALNFEDVSVDFLIAEISMPLALALILTAFLGFVVGGAAQRRK